WAPQAERLPRRRAASQKTGVIQEHGLYLHGGSMTLEMGSGQALGFVLGVSWGVSCSALAMADQRPPARVFESGNDRNGSEGGVEVAASPAQVVGALTNYTGWPELFSDIASVEIGRAGRDAIVRFQARSRPRPYTLRVKSGVNWVGFTLLDGR